MRILSILALLLGGGACLCFGYIVASAIISLLEAW